MPNRKAHVRVAAVTGAAAAGVAAATSKQSIGACIVETGGGWIGGQFGGRLPDVLNPPTSPRHRAFAHSFAAGGGTAASMIAALQRAQSACRKRADRCHATRTRDDASFLEVVLGYLGELFWRLLAGFIAGLPVGYLSHLAMDSMTPAGLPIV